MMTLTSAPRLATLFLGMSSLLALMTACEARRGETVAAEDLTAAQAQRDSSRSGILIDNFGMSTLSFRTDEGDTIEVMRSDVEGHDAQIWGDLNVDDRFVFTTTDGGESLARAINQTQLAALVDSFTLWNARLILPEPTAPDTVVITQLNADSLVATGRVVYRFGRPKTRRR